MYLTSVVFNNQKLNNQNLKLIYLFIYYIKLIYLLFILFIFTYIHKSEIFIPIETALSVYHSLFQSYLLYGSLAWSFTNQRNIDRITKIQKRFIRILTFAPFDAHTNPLFSKLGIIKVEDVILIQKLLFMLEVQQNTVPAEISKLFEINDTIHNHETRSSHLFHIPNNISLKSLEFNGPTSLHYGNNYRIYITECTLQNQYHHLHLFN